MADRLRARPGAEKVSEGGGRGVSLQRLGIGGKAVAVQAGPDDCVLALLRSSFVQSASIGRIKMIVKTRL